MQAQQHAQWKALPAASQKVRRPRGGKFGVAKSAQRQFHWVLIFNECHKSWMDVPLAWERGGGGCPHLSAPHLTCREPCQICGFISTRSKDCDRGERRFYAVKVYWILRGEIKLLLQQSWTETGWLWVVVVGGGDKAINEEKFSRCGSCK